MVPVYQPVQAVQHGQPVQPFFTQVATPGQYVTPVATNQATPNTQSDVVKSKDDAQKF